MSLGKTLLKVAIGVAVVKGVTALTKGGAATPEVAPTPERKAGRGTPFDPRSAGKPSGLEDLLKDVLGSGSRSTPEPARRDSRSGDGGGLGDLLNQMSGQKRSNPRATAPKGGLDDLLDQLTGRSSSSEADVGGSILGGTRKASGKAAGGGVGDLLDQVLADKPGARAGGPVLLPEPKREEELSSALMLRAVIQAVKCDGELDEDEKARLMQAMGEADAREVRAVQAELQRPVDVKGLARAVPAGLEPQVYVVSLMAINLDRKAEAEYLHKLAGELDLSPDQVNAIHDRAGAPRLYR